ncbi:hypothetical protein GA0070558_1951 [Micromonospora haikouensis]|uniref:Uncharacterized protein n=2 Tax=Actinomycetes TaxID=1760 RepID=A0A918GH01_9ACTN|nr:MULTISPECIES: hypothetical protein [Actinomycetes]GGS34169.1 hypothetical protein GCM10010269_83920 [Streptomyces humidus]SCF24353.1 hypothetical protein GA0070558_1951 [Micromonospora haikouensis]
MSGERIPKARRRALLVVAVAVVLLISVYAAVGAMRRGLEFEVSVNSYNPRDDRRVIDARVEMHPDFEVVRTFADFQSDRVILHVVARQPTLSWSGGDYADVRWVPVRLDKPLGDRQVLDAVSGSPVPRI